MWWGYLGQEWQRTTTTIIVCTLTLNRYLLYLIRTWYQRISIVIVLCMKFCTQHTFCAILLNQILILPIPRGMSLWLTLNWCSHHSQWNEILWRLATRCSDFLHRGQLFMNPCPYHSYFMIRTESAYLLQWYQGYGLVATFLHFQ